MKINFGLLSLATAQSGDFEDTTYDYDAPTDRWSNTNEFNLDDVNAGITFGVMARVTKQQNAKHFQKALKLSCWNSNMVRDMNNDNKFATYFLDQVEYKRFFPGIGDGTNGYTGVGGAVDTTAGADDLSWLYAVGDLRTGYNHQYGFEHSDSDPYYISSSSTDVDRMGHAEGDGSDHGKSGKNNNRLRQLDEVDYVQAFTTGQDVGNSGTKTQIGATGDNTAAGINVMDPYHAVRPNNKWTHRKWGYQSDNVEREASYGYAQDTVVYHFGHHDNRDNAANRPNFRFGATNETEDALLAAYASNPNDTTAKDNVNRHAEEYDFYGFKDDWRYSLRMGGCLYEAARWVYDESSFHRTSRLTYTDDTLFMDDPFNPMDGTDIFGAHSAGNIHGTALVDASLANIPDLLAAEQVALQAYTDRVLANGDIWDNTSCATSSPSDASCSAKVVELMDLWMELHFCIYQTAVTDCTTQRNNYNSKRDEIHTQNAFINPNHGTGCLVTSGYDTPVCCNDGNFQPWESGFCNWNACTIWVDAIPSPNCGVLGSNVTSNGETMTMFSVVNDYLGQF